MYAVLPRNEHTDRSFLSASGSSTASKLDNGNSSNIANGTAGSSNTILFAYRNVVVPQYVTYTQGQAKAVYVENWEKFDCPIIPDSYGIVVAYACMLELVRAVQLIIEGTGMRGDAIAGSQLRTSVQLRPLDALSENERHECIEVVNCTWSSVLVTFTLLYDVCYDDTTCELLLRGFQTYISLCGMLGMNVQRDAFATCLCKMALPPQYNIHLLSKQQSNEQQQQQSILQKLTARQSVDSSAGGDLERQQVVIIGTPLPLLNSTPATNQTAVMVSPTSSNEQPFTIRPLSVNFEEYSLHAHASLRGALLRRHPRYLMASNPHHAAASGLDHRIQAIDGRYAQARGHHRQ